MKNPQQRLICLIKVGLLSLSQVAGADWTDIEQEGEVMLGFDTYESFYNRESWANSNSEVHLRRLKWGVESELDDYWRFKMSLSANQKRSDEALETELFAFSIRYRSDEAGEFLLGKLKEPFGLERLASLRDSLALERSVVSNALAPGRSFGVLYQKLGKEFGWSTGLFESNSEDKAATAFTARSYFLPYFDDTHTIHLGASLSFRRHAGQNFQIRDSGEVYSASSILRSAKFNADSSQLIGLEFLWQMEEVILSGEYMQQKVEQDTGLSWHYSGYYCQGSYLLDGTRRYKKGELKSVKPQSDAGAWEVMARYSELNIRDNNLGSKSKIGAVGLNYYYSHDLQLKITYLMPAIAGNTLQEYPEGNALSLGMRYHF